MIRAALLLTGALACLEASGQGISFVTRRTSTLERQQRARAFFDAAGVTVNTPASTVTVPETAPALGSVAPASTAAPASTPSSPVTVAVAPPSTSSAKGSTPKAASVVPVTAAVPGVTRSAPRLPPVAQRARPFATATPAPGARRVAFSPSASVAPPVPDANTFVPPSSNAHPKPNHAQR